MPGIDPRAAALRTHASAAIGDAASALRAPDVERSGGPLRIALRQVQLDCDARSAAEHDESFVFSTHMVVRPLAALAAADPGFAADPLGVTKQVLRAEADGTMWWARPLHDLDDPGRVGLVAKVATRAMALVAALPDELEPSGGDTAWVVPPGAVRLAARRDVVRRVGGTIEPGIAVPTLEVVELRHLALVHSLATGIIPARVHGLEIRSHEHVVLEVDDEVLASALDRVVGAVALAAARVEGVAPIATPGPDCGWCTALPDCDAGRAHVHDPTRRIGALVPERLDT